MGATGRPIDSLFYKASPPPAKWQTVACVTDQSKAALGYMKFFFFLSSLRPELVPLAFQTEWLNNIKKKKAERCRINCQTIPVFEIVPPFMLKVQRFAQLPSHQN